MRLGLRAPASVAACTRDLGFADSFPVVRPTVAVSADGDAAYRLDRPRRRVSPRPMSTNPNPVTAIRFRPVNGKVARLEEGPACVGVVVGAPEGGLVVGVGLCGAAGVEAAGVAIAGSTITVPCMNRWMRQKYVNVPGC